MVAWRLLRVDGGSEVEVGEKRDRHDDALTVTRPAVEVGILPGGGVDLLKAPLVLSTNTLGRSTSPPMLTPNPCPQRTPIKKWGVSIIHRVPTDPVRTIRGRNPSLSSGPSVAQYGAPDKFAWGCNSQNRDTSILIAGIIRPVKGGWDCAGPFWVWELIDYGRGVRCWHA